MAGPVFCDVFIMERLSLSYVDLKLVFNRNIQQFCLMASEGDADYRVKLTDAYLKIQRVKKSVPASLLLTS